MTRSHFLSIVGLRLRAFGAQTPSELLNSASRQVQPIQACINLIEAKTSVMCGLTSNNSSQGTAN